MCRLEDFDVAGIPQRFRERAPGEIPGENDGGPARLNPQGQ
jgi:hypothetical protein